MSTEIRTVNIQSRHGPARQKREVQRLRKLATKLDSAITLPGGYRIGFDGLLGLVPIVGDGVSAIISLFIVYRAAQLGASFLQLTRMLLNVFVETLIGVIPLVGDLFDFVWKANEKNVAILERHLSATRVASTANARLSGAFVLLISIVIVIAGGFVVGATAFLLSLLIA
ncbi:DUF4112 domain-containing protein [Congregibacter litoralis]|uniref:DUF4112 domain-containing protein n=1 Tax=Congregibacter litoralis KT71 TaxID=314285 RepID=A4A4W9_9GAMM|nr:DUF4112 domain-containing protein [Congregibacter litoralis]EAQ98840.2 Domain protein of unknown function [Congregibacter litoralis KT71]